MDSDIAVIEASYGYGDDGEWEIVARIGPERSGGALWEYEGPPENLVGLRIRYLIEDNPHLTDAFSARVANALRYPSGLRGEQLHYLNDLIEWLSVPSANGYTGEHKLRNLRNVGSKATEEVRRVLARRGINL